MYSKTKIVNIKIFVTLSNLLEDSKSFPSFFKTQGFLGSFSSKEMFPVFNLRVSLIEKFHVLKQVQQI